MNLKYLFRSKFSAFMLPNLNLSFILKMSSCQEYHYCTCLSVRCENERWTCWLCPGYRCQVNNAVYDFCTPDWLHFSLGIFTCSGTVTLAVCRVFTMWRADIPKEQEMNPGRRCRLNTGVSNTFTLNLLILLLSMWTIRRGKGMLWWHIRRKGFNGSVPPNSSYWS